MAISYVNAASATSDSVSLPSGWIEGDLAIVFARNTGNATIPTLASGWKNKVSGNLNSSGWRVGWKFLQSGDTTTGTWTDATAIGVIIYSGAHKVAPLGTFSIGDGAVSTVTIPALTRGYTTAKLVSLLMTVSPQGADNYTATSLTNRTSSLSDNRFGAADSNTNQSAGETYTLTASTPWTVVNLEVREDSGFPIVEDQDTTSGVVTSNSSSWTLTYPTNIAAGDLVLAVLAIDGGGLSGSISGFGYNQVLSAGAGGAVSLCAHGKLATGSESGNFTANIVDSGTLDPQAEQGSWQVIRIPSSTWTPGAMGDFVSQTTGVSANPDPPSLDPVNFGTENFLWLAFMAADTSRTVSGYPANFTNTGSLASGGANGATLGWARLESAAASVDPGTFTISNSDDWAAATIAIRPRQYFSQVAQAQAQITSEGPVTTNQFAQAQTDIKTTYNVFAQSQSWIKQIYYGHAQANAQIIIIQQVFAQSQGAIKVTSVVFAQSQGHIKQTYQIFAQAQTSIKQTYLLFSQAQASIKSTNNNYAQSDAWIKQTYQGYAQAQAQILTTVNIHAQAQAEIIGSVTLTVFAQARTWIKQTYPCPHNYSQTILEDAPVAYWRLNEMTDTVMVDATGNHNGTWIDSNNQPWSGNGDQDVDGPLVGDSNKAYSGGSYGYGSYATVPYASVFDFTGNFTLECWVKVAGDNDIVVLAKDGLPGVTFYLYISSNWGYADFILGMGSIDARSGVDVVNGNWHYLVATYATVPNSSYLYIDGVDVTTHPGAGGTPSTGNNEIFVGSDTWNMPIRTFGPTDAVDEIAIYDYVLTPDQVAAHYRAGTWGATFAQSLAMIVITSSVHSQAQAYIYRTDNSVAQSQAAILTTYQGYSQAEAQILGAVVETYQWSQVQAQIKITTSTYAQSQAAIKQTYLAHSQVQAWVLRTEQGCAQAQSAIVAAYQAFGQAQAHIQIIVPAHANAQAAILITIDAYAQAQAQIKTIGQVVAQAGASITSTVIVHAQSLAYIYIPVYARPIADLSNNGWVRVVI